MELFSFYHSKGAYVWLCHMSEVQYEGLFNKTAASLLVSLLKRALWNAAQKPKMRQTTLINWFIIALYMQRETDHVKCVSTVSNYDGYKELALNDTFSTETKRYMSQVVHCPYVNMSVPPCFSGWHLGEMLHYLYTDWFSQWEKTRSLWSLRRLQIRSSILHVGWKTIFTVLLMKFGVFLHKTVRKQIHHLREAVLYHVTLQTDSRNDISVGRVTDSFMGSELSQNPF